MGMKSPQMIFVNLTVLLDVSMEAALAHKHVSATRGGIKRSQVVRVWRTVTSSVGTARASLLTSANAILVMSSINRNFRMKKMLLYASRFVIIARGLALPPIYAYVSRTKR